MKSRVLVLWCSLFILVVLTLLNFLLGNSTMFTSVETKSREYLRLGKYFVAASFGGFGECNVKLPTDFNSVGRRLTYMEPLVNAMCGKLLKGDSKERDRVRKLQHKWSSSVSDDEFLEDMSSCQIIVPTFFGNFYISDKEKQFPLGFVVLISYTKYSIQQYIRLFRFIYRPHNIYCIHIDQKSPKNWIKNITAFASCFPNILIARDAVEVTYASGAILRAHLNCLKELSFSQIPWKYAIDLHGTELPVVTNREIVDALVPLNGINAIVKGINTSNEIPGSMTHRKITYKAVFVPGVGATLSEEKLGSVPYNMTLFKGADTPNGAFSRNFVQFLLTDKRALALAEYLQDVLSAVEFYFSTLNNLSDAPGGRKEYLERKKKKSFRVPKVTVRFWKNSHVCLEGYFRHSICIISANDLQWLAELSNNHTHMFVNKYLIDYDHVVMDCMEEMLVKRNIEEYAKDCVYS